LPHIAATLSLPRPRHNYEGAIAQIKTPHLSLVRRSLVIGITGSCLAISAQKAKDQIEFGCVHLPASLREPPQY